MKSLRIRPRFTLRTLAILVTLVSAYFGAWEATKLHAVRAPQLTDSYDHDPYLDIPLWTPVAVRSPMPFVVVRDFPNTINGRNPMDGGPRRYNLWLFGIEVKLPFESSWSNENRWLMLEVVNGYDRR